MAEIKSAYRKKAKLLHPDRNPSLDAHERFVELSEAYDFIVAYRSGVYSRAARKGRNDSPEKRRAQEAKQREESRTRAQEHARMKFDAYKRTEHYKDSLALVVATRFATLLAAIIFLLVLPISAWLTLKTPGRIVTGIIVLTSMPVWLDVLRRPSIYLDFTDLPEAMGRVIRFEGFQVVTSLALNGTLFFTVCMSTMIPLYEQLFMLITAVALGYLITLAKPYKKFRPALSLGIMPFLFTGTLLINYVAAHSPVEENFSFRLERHYTGDGNFQEDVLITLEDNAYEEYAGIRFFLGASKFKEYRSITYTFEEGCIGWRVMRDYKLNP